MSSTSHQTAGRPRDATRDEAIVEAAAALLGEVGYDALTMDAVAARAGVSKATIYRRWSGKEALVLATVQARHLIPEQTPDTGTLRGDLLALWLQFQQRLAASSFDHLTGVLAAIGRSPALADAAREQLLEAWVRRICDIARRAAARGEIPAHDQASLELVARVGPSLVVVDLLAGERRMDPAFFERLVDEVLVPSLRRP